jgi:hypothetical protein
MDNFTTAKQRRQTWPFILRALVSVTLLVIILLQVDWQEFYLILADLSPVYLIFPIVGFYINILLSTYKWQVILVYLGIKKEFRSLLTTYMIGVYFSNFLPTSIGGDGYRFLNLRSDHPKNSDRIFSSLILERGYGYLTLLLVHFALLLAYWQTIFQSTLLMWIEIVIVLVVVAGILLLLLSRGKLSRLTLRWPRLKIIERVSQLLSVRDPRTIAVSIVTSFLFVLIGGIGLGMYYWAVGAQVNWIYAMYVSTLIAIIGIAPITVNGLGLVELVQIALMGIVEISGIENFSVEIVLAVSIIQRVLGLLLSIPGAVLYFSRPTQVTESLERTDDRV